MYGFRLQIDEKTRGKIVMKFTWSKEIWGKDSIVILNSTEYGVDTISITKGTDYIDVTGCVTKKIRLDEIESVMMYKSKFLSKGRITIFEKDLSAYITQFSKDPEGFLTLYEILKENGVKVSLK